MIWHRRVRSEPASSRCAAASAGETTVRPRGCAEGRFAPGLQELHRTEDGRPRDIEGLWPVEFHDGSHLISSWRRTRRWVLLRRAGAAGRVSRSANNGTCDIGRTCRRMSSGIRAKTTGSTGKQRTSWQGRYASSGDQVRMSETILRSCESRTSRTCLFDTPAILRNSERRVSRVLGQHRLTQRRIPRGRDDGEPLVADMIELRPVSMAVRAIGGSRSCFAGEVNGKRVERLWRREPGKQPEQVRLGLDGGSCIRPRAELRELAWPCVLSFTGHAAGGPSACSTPPTSSSVRDSRSGFGASSPRSASSMCWPTLLILSDVPGLNPLRQWTGARRHGWARNDFIQPGSPWKSGCIESFNARFRDGETFGSLKEAGIFVEAWRRCDNAIRPYEN